MSNESQLNRRQFTAISGSVMIAGMAGCSGDGGSSTPTATGESSTPTDGKTANTPTSAEDGSATEVSESGAENVIGSLAEYRNVANNPDEWVGKEIVANDVSYYKRYEDDYQGFRMVFNEENTARPFMLKTDQGFRENEKISFSGTVEKVDQIQNVKVLFVENVTIE